MRVFHGSAVEVTNPEIRTGKFTKDFGEGFYCTKLKRQAKRWAMRKETPTISVYEYAADKNLNILDFKGLSDEWLDFIVNCRKGIPHNYDIVIGAMANDQIYNHIEDFIAGILEYDPNARCNHHSHEHECGEHDCGSHEHHGDCHCHDE